MEEAVKLNAEYWKQQICALLKEVDNIERYILHHEPTTAQLRKAGMEKLGRPRRVGDTPGQQVDKAGCM